MTRKLILSLMLLFVLSPIKAQNINDLFVEKEQYGTEMQMAFPSDVEFYNKKIYVLDITMNSIFIFNLDGKLYKQIEFKSGKGPAEFSIGVTNFCVINDSLLAIFDAFKMEIFFVDEQGVYQKMFKVQDEFFEMFYEDGYLNIVIADDKNFIKKIDLEGNEISTYLRSPEREQDFFQGIPLIAREGKRFYYSNPYADEIFCWENEIQWKFRSRVPLIHITRKSKRQVMRLKSWSGIDIYKDYLIVTTYDHFRNNKSEKLNGPQLLILNKNNGELIKRIKCKEVEFFYSFDDKLFRYYRDPLPHIKRVELNQNFLE